MDFAGRWVTEHRCVNWEERRRGQWSICFQFAGTSAADVRRGEDGLFAV